MATPLEKIGRAIGQAREARGWSQGYLAEKIGISRPTMIGIEQGSEGTAIGTYMLAARRVGLRLGVDGGS